MYSPTNDNILFVRAELLEILTKGIAPAIPSEPWNADKFAEGVMTALNILAPLPKEVGDGLMTVRVNPEALHQAEDAEALKMNLDAASVPTKNEQGQEYSLWGRVQVFAGMNTNEPTLSSLGSSDS